MADERARPKRTPYTIASIGSVVIGVIGGIILASIIATGNADPDPATAVGPGWSALAATLTILGFGAAVLSKLAWIVVDLRHEVRELRAQHAAQSLETPQQRQPARQQAQPQGKRQRSRRNRSQNAQGGDPKEPTSGQPGGAGQWSPGDERYMMDIAEAARIGREMGGPASI